MTNAAQDVECGSRDRPAVEVTPEMIAAGARTLMEMLEIGPYGAVEVARAVYLSMEAVPGAACHDTWMLRIAALEIDRHNRKCVEPQNNS
jgi:hypothetical protein